MERTGDRDQAAIYDGGVTFIVAMLCLALVSVVAYAAARRGSSTRLGSLSRRQIAARLIVLGAVVAIGWLVFPVVWVAFFGYGCCNP